MLSKFETLTLQTLKRYLSSPRKEELPKDLKVNLFEFDFFEICFIYLFATFEMSFNCLLGCRITSGRRFRKVMKSNRD